MVLIAVLDEPLLHALFNMVGRYDRGDCDDEGDRDDGFDDCYHGCGGKVVMAAWWVGVGLVVVFVAGCWLAESVASET